MMRTSPVCQWLKDELHVWVTGYKLYKMCMNLKSAIQRCNAVDPKVVMGESSAVFNLAATGCIGIL